ncbi:hypothetical protein GC093_17500 [Paenibacillus sp. LMG 31456]|uniref:Lipoprotein n=1 Tax=Paenibacillus foliorum TaxID=2654974 RepID=A0A972K2J8_9BACL|nr:hypothetical protein [Paenibacillus foliorum]NOU95003.1 hypothetical protein [Paenibacillus foliorum]
MRKFIVGVIIASLLGLMGCSSPIEFKGKSDTWSVTCSVDQSANEKSFLIQYTGEKSQKINNLSYSFVDSENFKNNGENKNSSANLKISGSSTMDTPYVNEDNFKLIIKWNGKEETISVRKKE